MTDQLQPFSYRGFTDLLKGLSGGLYDMDLKPLIGRKLVSVEVSDDKEVVTFRFTDGFVSYAAEGHCCSQSWIEHITVPPDIAGAEITHWAENEMGEVDNADDWETIRVYQQSFRTDKGDIVLEYRNSSNGYYGGYLRGPVAQEPQA